VIAGKAGPGDHPAAVLTDLGDVVEPELVDQVTCSAR
jgi:hypothetical protein